MQKHGNLFPFQPLRDPTTGFETAEILREIRGGTPVTTLAATAHLTAFELCAAVTLWAEYMNVEDLEAETRESIRVGVAATLLLEGLAEIHNQILRIQKRARYGGPHLHLTTCVLRTQEAFHLPEPIDLTAEPTTQPTTQPTIRPAPPAQVPTAA
jgi:hypothetical protein